MVRELVSNANILEMFKEIDVIKSDENYTVTERDKYIKDIKDKVILKLSFLVYGQTRQYRNFPNYEDLVQEGFVGLARAVKKFDWTLNPNFFGYVDQWIRHSVKRAASRFDIVYNPNKTRVVYSEPDENEIDVGASPEEDMFNKELSENIDLVLCEFSEREREIVRKIFGLGGVLPETLREIGPQFNLTHERVRQIKNAVIDKLKKNERIIEMSRE